MREADAAERVGGFFEGRDDVRVPGLHRGLSSRRVLVMERIDGIKIDDAAALSKAGIDVHAVMTTLVEAYCEQIFVHGVFHADPHPGNLVVEPLEGERADGSRRFCIVFLDFGLTKTLPARFREATAAFAAALLGGDAKAMADSLAGMGFETREGGVEALEEITTVLLRTATRLRNQAFVDRDAVEGAAGELPRMIRENPIVTVPGHLVLVGRVTALLAGLGHSLQARVDMIPTILPYVMGVRGETKAPGAKPS
jgi:predicted unusual protein kinase regulating ubiquinone biosynthesis (AarF/ABC1/UbiB family)